MRIVNVVNLNGLCIPEDEFEHTSIQLVIDHPDREMEFVEVEFDRDDIQGSYDEDLKDANERLTALSEGQDLKGE